MAAYIKNSDGSEILHRMIQTISENRSLLGDIDGQIGDGDHGANMDKGFHLFEKSIHGRTPSFSEGLSELGMVLFNDIGGSMGPIYGTLFSDMADALEDREEIDASAFLNMLLAGLAGLYEILEARPGDKTLIDTLAAACGGMQAAVDAAADFPRALEQMKAAARSGMESTKDMEAKYGRSSRLGQRSVGVLDAGAVSCYLLLAAMADGAAACMHGNPVNSH